MIQALRQRLGPLRAHPDLHEPDYWLLATVLVLVMFGTVMVFSASFAIGVRQVNGNGYSFLLRQSVWALIGFASLLTVMQIDYRFWRRFSLLGMGLAALLLAAVVFVPHLGAGGDTWGAKRWIPLGPMSFQPSEFAKLALVIYLADWLGQKGQNIRKLSYGLIPFGLLLGALIMLVMKEPDLGTSALLAAIGVSVFLVAGANLFQLFGLMGIGSAVFLAMALGASYRRARILVFLNPDADLRNLGWQLGQAKLGLGSGGLFGLGLGASRQKFSWLPEAHTDAIFAVIGEELGLVGCVFVLTLFAILAWRGYRIALKAPDTFGTLLGVGIVTWLIFQAAINIGGITLTIPFTGIPLPFISYGGTSLAMSLTAIGLLLNISKQTADQPLPEPAAVPVRSQPRRHVGHRPVRGAPPRERATPTAQARPDTTNPPVWRPSQRTSTAPFATVTRGRVKSVDGRHQSRGGSFGRPRTKG